MAFLDGTGLAELWSLVKAEDAKLAAVDVKIETGTYSGTDKYGASNPNTLTFGFVPAAVIVATKSASSPTGGLAFIAGSSYGTVKPDQTKATVVLAWSGTSVTWHNTTNSAYQLNNSGTTYSYIAIG
jgi:hypothetical protein